MYIPGITTMAIVKAKKKRKYIILLYRFYGLHECYIYIYSDRFVFSFFNLNKTETTDH